MPVVATKVGELLDYIEPNVDMLMNNPKDYESISNNLLVLEHDKVFAHKLSTNAKNKAEKVFCANSYIDTLTLFLSAKS